LQIDIPDTLHEPFKKLVRERFLGDEAEQVSQYLQDLITFELRRACAPGYDRDVLTGLKTQYQLEKDLSKATFGSGWQDRSIFENNYLVIDIVNFKHYLDIHSLREGDLILQEIAGQLSARYKESHVYRFGGDEFVVDLGQQPYSPLQMPSEITLQHSIVHVMAQRNQRRNHYVNRAIMFYLEKGTMDATPDGSNILCEIGATS